MKKRCILGIESSSPHRVMVCLDFFLISLVLNQLVDTVGILPGFMSDHSVVTMSLALDSSTDRGPGFWKLYASLLQDADYIHKI